MGGRGGTRSGRTKSVVLARALRSGEEPTEFFHSVLSAVPAFIARTDNHFRIQYVNRLLPEFSAESVLGSSVFDYIAPGHASRARSAFKEVQRTGEPIRFTMVSSGPGGKPSDYSCQVTPLRDPDGTVGLCIVATDVSEQTSAQDQLRAAQKTDAIGQLTAGIAHNFNNMLMVLMPSLELLSTVVPASHAGILDSALKTADRAAEMVRDLMTMAGQSRNKRRLLRPIEEVLEENVRMCQRTFDRRITVDLQVDAAGTVYCDETSLQQVLLNLFLNARDALTTSGTSDPRIDVHLSRVPVRRDGETRRRDMFRVSVADNGPGVPEGLRQQIFDPFFTTKETGTGLGLATSASIVLEHGGWLDCATPSASAGAEFLIYLPPAPAEEHAS